MQTMTTTEQISQIRTVCENLTTMMVKDQFLFKRAHVNDWGRFGNFDIHVTPWVHDRSSTIKIKSAVKKLLPEGAKLSEIFGPDVVREYDRHNRRYRNVGYSRDYWVVDIDFQEFHKELNRFSGQLAGNKVDGYPVGI